MGTCSYCGKSAGLFRTCHSECERKHLERLGEVAAAQKAITAAVIRTISTSGDLRNLEKTVDQIEQASGLSPVERRLPLTAGWEGAVKQLLDDGILDDNEERLLFAFKERFELSQTDLDRNGALTKTAKAAFLRNLLKGAIPQRTQEEWPFALREDRFVRTIQRWYWLDS